MRQYAGHKPIKYLLFGSLQEMFADSWSRAEGRGVGGRCRIRYINVETKEVDERSLREEERAWGGTREGFFFFFQLLC